MIALRMHHRNTGLGSVSPACIGGVSTACRAHTPHAVSDGDNHPDFPAMHHDDRIHWQSFVRSSSYMAASIRFRLAEAGYSERKRHIR